MSKARPGRTRNPEGDRESTVVAFRSPEVERSPLDQLVRNGAQQMLQAAIEAEVNEFLVTHEDRRNEDGKRLVVRNGYKPTREIITGAGRLVRCGRKCIGHPIDRKPALLHFEPQLELLAPTGGEGCGPVV